MIRILLVDDNPLIRKMLRQLLEMEPDCRITGEADTCASALRVAAQEPFDVVLMDISLEGDESGIWLMRRIRETGNTTPILAISLHDESVYSEKVREAGGQGYVMKQEAAEVVVPAIRRVAAGQAFFSTSSTS